VTKGDESLLPFKQKPCFRGQVVDNLGHPVADADVFVFYFPLYGEKHLSGKSDVNGQFEIDIPLKNDEVTINMPVHYWATLPGDPRFTGWTLLDRTDHPRFGRIADLVTGFGGTVVQGSDMVTVEKIENGVTTYVPQLSAFLKDPVVEDILLVMEPDGVLAGHVTDVQGNIIPDAKIEAGFQVYGTEPGEFSGFSSSDINWAFASATNSEGYYELKGLPALWENCRYMLTATAPGYVSEKKEVRLEGPLQRQEFNISLEPQCVTIRGKLTDNYGLALEKRSVYLSVPDKAFRDCSTITDPNGCFVLEGCPDVPGLRVRCPLSNIASGDAYNAAEEELNAFLFYPDIIQDIHYMAGQKEYFVELTATRPETQVEVMVVNSAGKPLPEFMVKLDGFMTNGEMVGKMFIPFTWQHLKLEKRTDNEGRIVFDNVPDLVEMKLVVSPIQHFTREMHALNNNPQERQRLQKIDNQHRKTYQEMTIPVEVIEGQTYYFTEAVALTREDFQSLPD
jgi:hypothetical protein